MAFNYPPEKLTVYVSDDGCSAVTFYALLEASRFSKQWLPFCKRFAIDPRSPTAYFSGRPGRAKNIKGCPPPKDQWLALKKLYEDMKGRIESAVDKEGNLKQEIRDQHRGISEWDTKITKGDHHTILQFIIDGKDTNAVDGEGTQLPTLVYMAREKRPQFHHNFKAGAMNALIRVSSEISNAPIILNLDCDMYANNSDAIQEALCFFMDQEKGPRTSYVQFPQSFDNLSQNDIYSNADLVDYMIELASIDGFDAAMYCGTGCFHRRESLSGMKYSEDYKAEWSSDVGEKGRSAPELEEASKPFASCCYEIGTLWGKEMGLVYGCAVEDVVTGLAIQCRGWKPVYYNPKRKAFLGVAPTTLDQCLVQHKRWSEGLFQIFFSKFCPFLYGRQKIKLGAQMGYCIYLLWAPMSVPLLYYIVVPSLCLLHGIPLYPEVLSLWFLPFAYVFVATIAQTIVENLSCKQTLRAWWNSQRMWMFRRTTSYAFAFVDTLIKKLGFSQTTFIVTTKVVDDDVLKRYEQDIMEFGNSSLMFILIAALALLNLFCLGGGIIRAYTKPGFLNEAVGHFFSHYILSGLLVLVNLPVYEALFFRKDKGRMPFLVMFKSAVLASLVCLMPTGM